MKSDAGPKLTNSILYNQWMQESTFANCRFVRTWF